MHFNITNVIRMSLPLANFLHRIIVEDRHLHIIRTGDDPLFPHYKLCTPNRRLTDFETLDQGIIRVVPDENLAVVERAETPRMLRGEHVHRFHPLTSSAKLLLHFQAQRHILKGVEVRVGMRYIYEGFYLIFVNHISRCIIGALGAKEGN